MFLSVFDSFFFFFFFNSHIVSMFLVLYNNAQVKGYDSFSIVQNLKCNVSLMF